MGNDSVQAIEKIFMTYESALEKLKLLKIKTKNNKDVEYNNLKKAIEVMVKRHPTCRWKQKLPIGVKVNIKLIKKFKIELIKKFNMLYSIKW